MHSASVINDYADTSFSRIYSQQQNFVKCFACSYEAHVEFFDLKKCRKSCETVPLKESLFLYNQTIHVLSSILKTFNLFLQ